MEFLIQLAELLVDKKLANWYDKNIEGTKQTETIRILTNGVKNNEITIEQALAISLITGYQWNIKFPGVK